MEKNQNFLISPSQNPNKPNGIDPKEVTMLDKFKSKLCISRIIYYYKEILKEAKVSGLSDNAIIEIYKCTLDRTSVNDHNELKRYAKQDLELNDVCMDEILQYSMFLYLQLQ